MDTSNTQIFDQFGVEQSYTEIEDYIGNEIIGQPRLKSRLNFYIHGQRNDGFLPFTLFQAQKGYGKTHAARVLARGLTNRDASPRKAIEVNASSIGGISDFIDSIIIPYANKEFTLFIDEVSELKPKILTFLLSVLQPNEARVSIVRHNGFDFVFDFHQFNFICATTNAEKLSQAFKSRFARRVEIEPYSAKDLTEILYRNINNILFEDSVQYDIVDVCRESPREVVMIAQNEIKPFCASNGMTAFNKVHWSYLKKLLNIRPLGLNASEISLLKHLVTGPKTLTNISGKLGLDIMTVRKEVELFMLSKGLIYIDGCRHISSSGLSVLAEIEAQDKIVA